MPDREAQYRFRRDDSLTAESLNSRVLDINARLLGVEIERLSEDEAFGLVLDRVLSRSEAVIANLRDQLLAITQLQWLTASSSTALTPIEGDDAFLIIPEDQRDLFTPGPFAVLSREATPEDYAIVRTSSVDRETGRWDFSVETIVGDPGPHADWLITAIAGSTLAQLALLQQGRDARDAAVAAAESVADIGDQVATAVAAKVDAQAAAATATTRKNEAETARDAAIAAKLAAEAAAASVDGAALDARLDVLEAQTAGAGVIDTRLDALELGREAEVTVAIAAGVLTLNLAAGSDFKVSLNANITSVVLQNWPAAGTVQAVNVEFFFDGTPRTITWPAACKPAGGTFPTLGSTNGKSSTFTLRSSDGGTKVRVYFAGEAG
jgi:hypothetical protein